MKQEFHVLMFKDIRVSAPYESSVDFLRHIHLQELVYRISNIFILLLLIFRSF